MSPYQTQHEPLVVDEADITSSVGGPPALTPLAPNAIASNSIVGDGNDNNIDGNDSSDGSGDPNDAGRGESSEPSPSQQPGYLPYEDDPETVLAQLVSLGFDSQWCQVAIAEALENEASTSSLFELVLNRMLDRQDQGDARAITYSPAQSPKPSRPNSKRQPTKGILKPGVVPPQQTTAFAGKSAAPSWFAKGIGSAAIAFAKFKTSAAIAANEAVNTINDLVGTAAGPAGGSGSSTPPLLASDGTEALPARPAAGSLEHRSDPQAFVIDNGSMSSLESNLAPAPKSQSIQDVHDMRTDYRASIGGSERTSDLGSLELPQFPKRVRFSFPDIRIDPEEFSPVQTSPSGASASTASPSAQLDAQNDPEADEKAHWELEKSAIAPTNGSVVHLFDQGGFTSEDLHQYYTQSWQRRGEQPIEKLNVQLLTAIESKSILTRMDLSGTTIDRKHVASLADILMIETGLVSLSMENCNIEDEILKVLLHSVLITNTLQSLSLANNRRIKVQGVKYVAVLIKKTKSLKHLDISGISIDRQGMGFLSHALAQGSQNPPVGSTLETLKMDSCQLRAPLLEVLAIGVNHSQVIRLSLRDNKMNADCGLYLFDLLKNERVSANGSTPIRQQPRTRGIESLDLRGNELKSGVHKIARALGDQLWLRHLVLRDNKMDHVALVILSEHLKTNRTVTVLDLSSNPLCLDSLNGVTALLEALVLNKTLKELSLANTHLNSEGAIAFAEAMPLIKSVQKLDITYNPIDIAGVLAISVSLKLNNSFTMLELAPFLDPQRGVISNQSDDMARLLNDISIYCQRNEAILQTKHELDGDEQKDIFPSIQPLTPPNPRLLQRLGLKKPPPPAKNILQLFWDNDPGMQSSDSSPRPSATSDRSSTSDNQRSSFNQGDYMERVSNATETLGLFEEVMEEIGNSGDSDGLLEQLNGELAEFQENIKDRIASGLITDEAILGHLLLLNDRLGAAFALYQSRKEASAEHLEDPAPSRFSQATRRSSLDKSPVRVAAAAQAAVVTEALQQQEQQEQQGQQSAVDPTVPPEKPKRSTPVVKSPAVPAHLRASFGQDFSSDSIGSLHSLGSVESVAEPESRYMPGSQIGHPPQLNSGDESSEAGLHLSPKRKAVGKSALSSKIDNGTTEEFLKELDEQMKEIDEFLHPQTPSANTPGGKSQDADLFEDDP
ncbi:uncharacterized protein BJ171DRAFT_514631 [Polychytrium aggregatum]|uniref:uncharacterized protein n=1 Tax=Polychytrium aggregatum TaxID=110093 RepID=UPI0022FECCDD|nr:uncharacterized protein BJ171DRAFT_514631 [Polychytrium aggregatum]KAI9202272.1 hypothetical protein BJ171DRAFT_514631 [Polychytrium aggregatum]